MRAGIGAGPARRLTAAVVTAAVCMSGLVATTSANAAIVGWGGRDVTFTPPPLNGPVETVIQLRVGPNAGKYLIGGSFTDAGGNANIDYVARLHADGALDSSFVPPTLSPGSGSCYEADDSFAPTIQVRSLLENPTASGTNAAGTIYLGGNFADAGGNVQQDYLVRLGVNGALDTGFSPTNDGTSAGTPSYTNCVHTMFTGEGSGNTLALIVGRENYDMGISAVTKKVFDTGADYAGFTAPTMNDSVTTGFYCPASISGCRSADRYVLGGRFSRVNSNSRLARLVRLNTDGSVDTSAFPTTNGTATGSTLFSSYVNSISLTSSQGSILVGGRFSGRLAKINLSNFAPDRDFVAPWLNGQVYSVAVDRVTGWYLFGGAFTNADDYPACDYVCVSSNDGDVTVDDRSLFAAPPPTAQVNAVAVNNHGDSHSGKYMLGGDFTDLGGNSATDYVARLNHASPDAIVFNSSGGNLPDGADGIKTIYTNGQWQVYREGAGQLYEPDTEPPDPSMFNQVALSLAAPGGGGYVVGPSSLNLWNQNIDFEGGFLYRPWDSATATGGGAGSASGVSELTVEVDGRTYVVRIALDYTSPENYIRQTFTVDIPAGNTYTVKLFNLYDSYLGGSDFGPGFYDPVDRIVGVSGSTAIEGLRYVSGQDWAGYMSANYYDVVFGNTDVAAAPTGPGFGANLDNSLVTDPDNDNGFGVNWDFGSASGTTAPVVTDLLFLDNTPPVAAPTSAAGEVKVDWTDPVGISVSPDSYLVTAYDGSTPTAQTCTVTAPAKTCTLTGLDPAVAYSFLVSYLNGGVTVFNSASNEVHPKREVTLRIWGDPTSVGPPVTFGRTLGADPANYMAAYAGLTAANQAAPVVTPSCAAGSITAAEATAGGQAGEYYATVGCQDGLTDITSYSVAVNVGAGSCLVAAGLPTGAGLYPVGTAQQSLPVHGTALPDGGGTQAFRAMKGATPSQVFAADAIAGVYFPATRPCQPSSAPTTTSTSTTSGGIPLVVTAPVSNGGSALFAEPDVGNVDGYNRVLAKPSNTTGIGGGFRDSYFRCGVTNASGTDISCLLSSVRVTSGGSRGLWNPATCSGQTINFRSRYMSQMGYGLWSDEGPKTMTGGCS